MKCSECTNYSFKVRRCTLEKINPKTIKGGIEAVRFMGLGYICHLNAKREQIKDEILNLVRKEQEYVSGKL